MDENVGSGVQLCGPEQVFLFLCDLLSLSAFLTIAPTSLGLCWSLTSLFSDPLLTIPLKHISCLPAVFSPCETLARDWRAREGRINRPRSQPLLGSLRLWIEFLLVTLAPQLWKNQLIPVSPQPAPP